MFALSRPPRVVSLIALLTLPLATAAGQEAHSHGTGAWVTSGSAQVIPILTRATPTAGRQSLTEAYLTQPVLTGQVTAFGGRLAAHGMLNLEGVTLARGELNTGTHGEGYVDRRHPHSYVHELLATARADVALGRRTAAISLTAGRGFAPFGSDDPMSRPFAKYPVNHHLAQVLERLVVIAAARSGPLTLEGGIFNGDEPTNSRSAPKWSRFGDSWSARATLRPAHGVEIAASAARVESPEFREGLGLDQRKTSAVLRIEQPVAGGAASRYLFVEWARTHDDRRGRLAFTYTSFLAEGAYCHRGRWGALRVERTVRPEEERLIDPFRTPRPQIEFAILGRTRWTAVTAAAGTNGARAGVLSVAPFVEASYARPERVEELGAFVPQDFYGSSDLWLLSVGARVSVGRRHRRMGRYGVAADGAPAHAAASLAAPRC
ncbi:MAG: hypothetical protein M3282_02295 [Gemmatimonadota bacterium]|nr:hypothetical protein [Gemmatimonadota bacterium]